MRLSAQNTHLIAHLLGYQVDIVFIWEKTDWDFTAFVGVLWVANKQCA